MRDTMIIAERFGLVRDGLVALLSAARASGCGPREVWAAASLSEATAMLAEASDGVLLLDLGLIAGPADIRLIRARYPAWHIVALAEQETRDGVLQCLSAGAHGYVAKTAGAAELVRAVDVVETGGVHVPSCLAAATPVIPADRAGSLAPVDQLTGRQRDVLRLMAEGRSTKDIARTLDLAVSTIKVHLAAVYRTVGARNRVEALCRAGLLPRDAAMS